MAGKSRPVEQGGFEEGFFAPIEDTDVTGGPGLPPGVKLDAEAMRDGVLLRLDSTAPDQLTDRRYLSAFTDTTPAQVPVPPRKVYPSIGTIKVTQSHLSSTEDSTSKDEAHKIRTYAVRKMAAAIMAQHTEANRRYEKAVAHLKSVELTKPKLLASPDAATKTAMAIMQNGPPMTEDKAFQIATERMDELAAKVR